MNFLDFLLIIIVAGVGFFGIWMGFIRAAFGALGIVLGILIAGQASDNLGGLFAGLINSEPLANGIAYGFIIIASLIVARVLTVVVRGIFTLLLMGWVDRLAGLGIGVVAGLFVAGAAIMGLAELTYNSDILDKGVSSGGLEGRLDPGEVREGLEVYLVESELVGVFIDVADKLPANALGFVPPNLMLSFDVLEQRKGSQISSKLIPTESIPSP